MNGHAQVPVRSCCGTRHLGALCPDGHFMCCHCFDRFPLAEASIADGTGWIEAGQRVDVCWPCAWADGPLQTLTGMARMLGHSSNGEQS